MWGVAGSSPGLVGLPPAGMSGIRPLLFPVVVALVGHHTFMARRCVDGMTNGEFCPRFSIVELLPASRRGGYAGFVWPKLVWTLPTLKSAFLFPLFAVYRRDSRAI